MVAHALGPSVSKLGGRPASVGKRSDSGAAGHTDRDTYGDVVKWDANASFDSSTERKPTPIFILTSMFQRREMGVFGNDTPCTVYDHILVFLLPAL